jgi:hypothetical protein
VVRSISTPIVRFQLSSRRPPRPHTTRKLAGTYHRQAEVPGDNGPEAPRHGLRHGTQRHQKMRGPSTR